MTLLRTREIVSHVRSKAETSDPLPNPENVVVVEPATPSKTVEFMSQPSNSSTPVSSASGGNCGPVEVGLGSDQSSIVIVEAGTGRRRSARLATKVGVGYVAGDVRVVSGKRKKVEGSSLGGEGGVRSLGKRALNFNLKRGESSEVVGCVSHGLVDGGVSVLVTRSKEVEDSGNAEKLGWGDDVGNLGVGALNNGKRRRRYSMEMKSLSLESCKKDEVGNGHLNLRSGKRVVKRDIEGVGGSAGKGLKGIETSKNGGVVLADDSLVKTNSEPTMQEDENGGRKVRRFTRGEKGKGKVDSTDSFKLNCSAGVSLGDSCPDAISLPKTADPKEVVTEKGTLEIETSVMTRGRLRKEEKGKMKLRDYVMAETKENLNRSSVSGTTDSARNAALQERVQVTETDASVNDTRSDFRERFRNFARQNASRFAHFSSQEELGNRAPDVANIENSLSEADNGIEDWPGPFSTAMKIIKDRTTNKHGERHVVAADKSEAIELKWIRKEHDRCNRQMQLVPSLQEMCLSILAKNADAITSLDCIPDVLRHKISWCLCDSRRMDAHFLELLVQGYPAEIRVRDCSWLSEQLFTKTFEGCNTSKLTVFQFDQCGGCLPDYALSGTLAYSPNSLPALTTISLKGAYRLTDAGISTLVSSAPNLKSIDISQCPLITSEGIYYLANSLRSVLQELYLDNCHGIDAMLILPVLLALESLKVLSLAGIETVCDDFIIELVSVHGSRMKELVLADCMKLTDLSVKVIGDTCSGLCALDLTNLSKLTDASIGYIANGCVAIQRLKFCRNLFSDEAVAAYLDVRGAFLKDLSLNNVVQVSNHTALSLARNCRSVRSLDLSWCRNLTNEALGLIVDSCSSLEVLKLFGCTQVTNVFVDGHSNKHVKLIGLKMTPVFKHIDVPDFLLGPLRYSSASH